LPFSASTAQRACFGGASASVVFHDPGQFHRCPRSLDRAGDLARVNANAEVHRIADNVLRGVEVGIQQVCSAREAGDGFFVEAFGGFADAEFFELFEMFFAEGARRIFGNSISL